MCGRFVRHSPFAILKVEFGLVGDDPALAPSYNVAPTRDVLAVVEADGRRLSVCRWGLVPPWSSDRSIGSRMINARAETLAERPSFRGPFRSHRCLVVADGFYEWRRDPGGGKTPFYIRRRDGRPLGLAGLFSDWVPPEGGPALRTCAIVTTEANALLRPIHDRMPAIPAAVSRALWLDPAVSDPAVLRPLLAPPPAEPLEAFPVSAAVNSPSTDGPGNIRPLGP